MEVRFAAPTMEQLDDLNSEALALPFFSDERPFKGVLGLVDWRLCGRLSRMRERGRITGDRAESTLLPGRPRLRTDKLFLFGVGPAREFDRAVLADLLSHMFRTINLAGARTSAMVLPGRALERVAPTAAAETFVRIAAREAQHDQVVLLESAEAQREMRPVVEAERRRARAAEV